MSYARLLYRVTHRKWRESKQQPSRARSGNQLSCCLVSLHFLCDILTGRPVVLIGRFLNNGRGRSRGEESEDTVGKGTKHTCTLHGVREWMEIPQWCEEKLGETVGIQGWDSWLL